MADENKTEYEYGKTPEETDDGLLSYFSGIWGPDRSPSSDWFTGTRREVISPRKEEWEKYWTGVEGEYGYRKKVTPGEYGEPEHGLEYMPVYRAAQGIGDFFEDIISSPEAREEAADALLTGISQVAEDQMQAIGNVAAGGEPQFYDEAKGRVIGYDPLLISSPSFAAGALFPVKGSGAVSGMFVGRNSPVADFNKLHLAEDMARSGNSREDIWAETGWFRYHDKEGNPIEDWRFEISDDQAKAFKNESIQTPTGRLKKSADPVISDLLHHPEVFAAYPGANPVAYRGVAPRSGPPLLSLKETNRQRSAIKLELKKLNDRRLDIDDPVYVAEYQRLQDEDAAILEQYHNMPSDDGGWSRDLADFIASPVKISDRPLADVTLTTMTQKHDGWGGAYYSSRSDKIGSKMFPGQDPKGIMQKISWDEKGEYFQPLTHFDFDKLDKEARETFKRAGISLDSSGSYNQELTKNTGNVFDSSIDADNPPYGRGIKYSLRKWDGTDSIDPDDLPAPYLREIWDLLQHPGHLFYKKDYDKTEEFRSLALHEIQHAIQHREARTGRWQTGSSPKEFGGAKSRAAIEKYMRTFGEAEARNVQKRRDMTPEDRKQNPPWETLDRAEGDLRTREQLGLRNHDAPALGAEGSLRDTAFEKLAYLQRGDPELAMLDVQNAYGGGVYSVLVEHVGDITHRMSEMPGYLEGGLDSVAPKVRRALNVLRSEYTPQREYDESLRNNAQYNNVALEDRAASVDKARENYTEQHRKLPVYNEMQRNARDAAIAIGEQRWADAQSNLEYIEQFLDDPKAYKAEAMKYNPSYQDEGGMAQGGLVNAPLSVNPDVLEYGMYRTPFDMRRAIAAQRFAEGGIASLPKSPVLGGQQHMLAYITPEEASTLRAQGGGVTPDGGQYTGPGGIAAFAPGAANSGNPGQASAAAAAAAASANANANAQSVANSLSSNFSYGLGEAAAEAANPTGNTVSLANNTHFNPHDNPFSMDSKEGRISSNTPKGGEAEGKGGYPAIDFSKVKADQLAQLPLIALIDEHQKLDPRSIRAQQLAMAISKSKKGLADSGVQSGIISKFNFMKNPGDQDGFFGKVQGLVDPFGNEFSMADISAMSPAEFSALSSNASTSVIGDPESPFGRAVTALGTTALGLVAPALSPALGLMGLAMDAAGVKGMASLAGDAFSYATDSIYGETASDAESADSDSTVGQVGDALSNAYGFVSDAVSDAYGYAGDAVSDAAFSAAQSLGQVDADGNVAQASPFSVTPGNMGAGLQPAQQPSALVPTTYPIDNIGPLGTVTPEPSTGRFFTIDELKNLGVGQIPSTTSIFAQGGLVDKPLYSRN